MDTGMKVLEMSLLNGMLPENKGVYLLLSDDVLDLELPVRGRT